MMNLTVLCISDNNFREFKTTLDRSQRSSEELSKYIKKSIEELYHIKDKKDIFIKTSFLPKEVFQELEKSIKINLISDQFYTTIKLNNNCKYYLYQNVTEINIEFKIRNININKNNFSIRIIPLKNKKLLEESLKYRKDYKIISSIEKCIIHYLLFLFEDIKSQIEKYNNDIIIKNLRKIFQSEVFKFLSIPIDKLIINNFISFSKFNEISNQLLEKLYKNIDNIEKFFSLNNELLVNLNKINKEIYQNKYDFQINYEDKIKKIMLKIQKI